MSETIKTAVFVVAATAAALVAWATAPKSVDQTEISEVGQEFFPEFEDPNDATSLEIVEYDEKTGQPRDFKVQQVKGVWSIPSHLGYPADAERQLEEAAASVMDLRKLNVASSKRSDHELYGVVEPDPKKAEAGMSGVGKLVRLQNAKNTNLAQFIIGKEDPKSPGIRFVRVPGQDTVYRVKLDVSKLTTKFEEWIEPDLLKMNPWDIRRVTLNNYSVDEINQRVIPGDTLELAYNDKDSKWSLEGLAEGEELDAEKLNALKTALDELKIVDVRRKPAGLSQGLKAEEGIKLDQEAVMSLAQKGFYLSEGQLLSNEGEVIVRLSDGVEYVLRFGEIAAGTGGGSDGKEKTKSADETGEDEESGDESNRYLFLTAQFNPDLIPKPELVSLDGEDPMPTGETEAPAEGEEAAGTDEPATDAEETEATGEEAGDTEEAAETEAPSEETESPSEEDAAADDAASEGASPDEGAGRQPSDELLLAQADDDAEAPDAPETTEPSDEPAGEPSADENAEDQPGEEQPETSETAAERPAADGASATKEPGAATPKKPLTGEERTKAEKDNKKKQDEYEAKVKKGNDRVKELNERFADWYYVISDSVYQKIHLSREDVIKAKQAPLGGEGTNELEKLKKALPGAGNSPAADGDEQELTPPETEDPSADTDAGEEADAAVEEEAATPGEEE